MPAPRAGAGGVPRTRTPAGPRNFAAHPLQTGTVDVFIDGSGEGVAASPAIGSGTIDVTFVLTGVAASPAIGAGAISVTFLLTGVAASTSLGAGAVSVTFALSGVAASPAIGAGTIDVACALTGVSASPAIGAGTLAIDFTAAGVAASPALGAGTIDVTFLLTGVAADPEIGAGTIQGAIDVPPSQQIQLSGGAGLFRPRARERWLVAVVAPGVAANPQIGVGRVDVTAAGSPAAKKPKGKTRRPVRGLRAGSAAVATAATIIHVSFSSLPAVLRPAMQAGAIGQGSIDVFAAAARRHSAVATAEIGEGHTHSVVELFEDEILALLAAA
jgi:hypothetical protein